jgi:hypothetical protein
MSVSVRSTPFETPSLDQCLLDWRRFCNGLRREGSVAIVYHGDADGAVAASVVDHILTQHLKQQPALYWVGTDEYDFGELQRWLQRYKTTRMIFLDVAIENEPSMLACLLAATQGTAFIFDHHLVRQDTAVEGAILANPTPNPLRPGEIPVPSFAFALALSRTCRLSFPDWLLAYVSFAEGVDSFVEPFMRHLVSSIAPLGAGQSLRDWYRRSRLGRVGSLVRAAFSDNAKTHEVVRLMQTSILEEHNSCEALLNGLESRFGPSADRIARVITQLVSHYEQDLSTASGRLVALPINDVHAVAGPVASILRGKAPDKVILTSIRKNGIIVCELRTGVKSETNLVELLKRVAESVPMVNFGGHASAAGALVAQADFDLFLLTLRSIVER